MKRIANALFLKTTLLILALMAVAGAGVLQNLDNELTALVESAEPYLVTVETKPNQFDKVFVGSGILIDNDGYIISTTSVIGECKEAEVSFKSGDSYKAEVVGCDYHSGLALLKIEPVDRAIPEFGDSYSLKEGSWIIVMGNAYEVPNAVNLGVYSGLTVEGFLQLSVQSGPGSSGSAVFNTKGQLIGLLVAQASETISFNFPGGDNSWISRASGYSSPKALSAPALGIELPASGTSLAVPIAKLEMVIRQLKEFGEVKHGFLGIRQQPLKSGEQKELNIEGGVRIIDVVKDSPAEEAGLSDGDILTKFNDKVIKSPGHLYSLVRSHQPDDKITLEIIREGNKKQIVVSLDEAPNDGYFGFRYFPQRQLSELQYDFADLKNRLSDKMQASKDKLHDQEEIEIYLKKLEEKIAGLEDDFKKLSDKLDELNKEMDQK